MAASHGTSVGDRSNLPEPRHLLAGAVHLLLAGKQREKNGVVVCACVRENDGDAVYGAVCVCGCRVVVIFIVF